MTTKTKDRVTSLNLISRIEPEGEVLNGMSIQDGINPLRIVIFRLPHKLHDSYDYVLEMVGNKNEECFYACKYNIDINRLDADLKDVVATDIILERVHHEISLFFESNIHKNVPIGDVSRKTEFDVMSLFCSNILKDITNIEIVEEIKNNDIFVAKKITSDIVNVYGNIIREDFASYIDNEKVNVSIEKDISRYSIQVLATKKKKILMRKIYFIGDNSITNEILFHTLGFRK